MNTFNTSGTVTQQLWVLAQCCQFSDCFCWARVTLSVTMSIKGWWQGYRQHCCLQGLKEPQLITDCPINAVCLSHLGGTYGSYYSKNIYYSFVNNVIKFWLPYCFLNSFLVSFITAASQLTSFLKRSVLFYIQSMAQCDWKTSFIFWEKGMRFLMFLGMFYNKYLCNVMVLTFLVISSA